MPDILSHISTFLGAGVYVKRSLCISSDPILMVLYLASDMTTALACVAIGISLTMKRHLILELSTPAIAMYGAFIFLCGLTYASMTLTLFSGVYRLDIAIRAAMAAVSTVTAVYTVLALWGDSESTAG